MYPTPLPRLDDRRHRAPAPGGLLIYVQEQLAVLRDRELGRELGLCTRCARPVRSQQGFSREHGSVAHVRCSRPQPNHRPARDEADDRHHALDHRPFDTEDGEAAKVQPMHRQPMRSATTSAVPEPQKKSATR